MFQFNDKIKVSERVKAKSDRHPRCNPNARREEATRLDPRLASLFSIRIRRGYRRRLPGFRIAIPWTRLRQPLAKSRSERGQASEPSGCACSCLTLHPTTQGVRRDSFPPQPFHTEID
jgi:hypothetical protein